VIDQLNKIRSHRNQYAFTDDLAESKLLQLFWTTQRNLLLRMIELLTVIVANNLLLSVCKCVKTSNGATCDSRGPCMVGFLASKLVPGRHSASCETSVEHRGAGRQSH